MFRHKSVPKFWKNEFPWSNSALRKYSSREKINVVEYARYCTLHGIQYVFKENSSFIERFLWLLILVTSFICASLLVYTMWNRFSMSPTMTVVKNTHLPLYSIPFPAVSICSTDKIMQDKAYSYLSSYVDLSPAENIKGIDNFLTSMSLFQHPLYSRMSAYLQNFKFLLPSLSLVNLTDFMLHVMPKCNDTFSKCFWVGKSTNCCDLFKLQRTEEGFCYSFNSIISHFDKHCENNEDFCSLRRNTAAGSSSGLEVFFNSFNLSNRIKNATDSIGVPGYRVQIFNVAEYPETGMGNLIESHISRKLSLIVKAYVTSSTEAIRQLDTAVRFCYFPDEYHLSISYSYSQKSCLIECRLHHLKKVCNCRPYYFNLLDNSVPICNATQLDCIAEHTSELVFFSPPSVEIRGFNDSDLKSLLNCSQCLPACHETIYDIDAAFSEDTQPLARESFGNLDIFYKNEGAVKYERDVTFGWIDLLVSFGGIAGLFLGFSLLSIVEFIYWSIKLTIHHIFKYVKNYIVTRI